MILAALVAACAPAAPADDILLEIAVDGASDWRIIVPRGALRAETEAAELLRDAIAAASGVTLEIADDYTNEKRGILPTAHEILVGETSRAESLAESRKLRTGDSEVTVVGGKLVIMGGSAELTLDAARALADKIRADAADGAAIKRSFCSYTAGSYEIPTITLEGVDLRESCIVYPAGNADIHKIADELCAYFKKTAGVRLLSTTDDREVPGRRIILNADGDIPGAAAITAAGDDIIISGGDIFDLRHAAAELCDNYFAYQPGSGVPIHARLAGAVIRDESPRLSVMSFNILCHLDEEPERADRVIDTVRKYMPDSVGFQEVTEQWLEILIRRLGDSYDWVGEINDESGQRWRNAIFYRRDRLELVSAETRWLSATPQKRSKVTASSQYRIYTLAHFRCIGSGREWVHINTHLSYEDAARSPQIRVLLSAIERQELPCAVTGDFNFAPGTPYYSDMTAGGVDDSKYLTPDRDDKNTCAVNIIDYCYVSRGNLNVRRYRVEDSVIASDHRAVYVEFSFLHSK